MKNDSWFGHLALCIVLRHRVAVFSKRRVALRHSEEFLSLQNIKRGEGVATYKRHLNFLVFSLNKQVDETLSRIHRRSNSATRPVTRFFFHHGKGSSLLHLMKGCSFNARVLSMSQVGEKNPNPGPLYPGDDAMEHEWHSYGI